MECSINLIIYISRKYGYYAVLHGQLKCLCCLLKETVFFYLRVVVFKILTKKGNYDHLYMSILV